MHHNYDSTSRERRRAHRRSRRSPSTRSARRRARCSPRGRRRSHRDRRPTEAAGRAVVDPSMADSPGAGGRGRAEPLAYLVPWAPWVANHVIEVPFDLQPSSIAGDYQAGSAVTLPLTLLTTLADHEAVCLRARAHPVTRGEDVPEAFFFSDPRTDSSCSTSPPWPRGGTPGTCGRRSGGAHRGRGVAHGRRLRRPLRPRLERARPRHRRAGRVPANSRAMNAITLAELLEEDLDADAVLDGRGQGGAVLSTQGTSPVALDAQFLRSPLAQALDTWVGTSANESGIARADLESAGVYDAIALDASDLFGAPPAGRFDPVDTTPPVLALVTPAPLYVQAAALTLRISASDPSGVKAVYALAGAGPSLATLQPDGTWLVTLALPATGQNTVTVWGEDKVTPTPNSGLGKGAPYELTLEVIYDPTPPSVTYDASIFSYSDERSLALGVTSDGVATVPPTYAVGPRVGVLLHGDIYKAYSRLGAVGGLSAAELESTNAGNIPFLRFAVPYRAGIDAPNPRPRATRCTSPARALARRSPTRRDSSLRARPRTESGRSSICRSPPTRSPPWPDRGSGDALHHARGGGRGRQQRHRLRVRLRLPRPRPGARARRGP